MIQGDPSIEMLIIQTQLQLATSDSQTLLSVSLQQLQHSLIGTIVAAGDRDINTFGGVNGWSNNLYSMPPGYVYAAAGTGEGTELRVQTPR
ncbi:MAG: hypothetical protein R2883_00125 [Caldisericia bacterium]